MRLSDYQIDKRKGAIADIREKFDPDFGEMQRGARKRVT